MKLRSGKTGLSEVTFRQATDERGQMASTICVDESRRTTVKRTKEKSESSHNIPTRLSTKLTFRSDCRTRAGGQGARALEVLRGF
jgi:hypothetical protein